MENGYDLNHLLQEAKSRWLTPVQLLFILRNHHPSMIQHRVHQIPASGSLFLFNKITVSSFRRDGHNWRKKRNRNTVDESHEKLKVDNAEALVCYYAKGAIDPNFRRRIYWMLENKDIVLVHYLDIAEGKTNSASILECSTVQSYTVTPSVIQGSPSLGSPLSVEVTSREVAQERRELFPRLAAAQNVGTSPEVEMFSCQIMQELKEQLGLNSNIVEQSSAFNNKIQNIDSTAVIRTEKIVRELDQGSSLQKHGYSGKDHGKASSLTDRPTWQETAIPTASQAENLRACLERTLYGTSIQDTHSIPDPSQTQIPLRVAEQKFKIAEISPQWCFADEVTKVIIIGTFKCDPSEPVYAMFGDIAVEAQIMQNGVLCCHAPPNCPGKVSFCLTSGNQESCSEVKNFEYRDRNSTLFSNYAKLQEQQQQQQQQQQQDGRMEEAKLLVDFVEMLSVDSSLQELLEDKLQQWLRTRFQKADNKSSCTLSQKERGIIHLVAGLGLHWALNTILDSGVGVNFRDTNGWTALHWAARFGREEMVGALIACGASVSALTDPTAQDPMGKNAASIADANGHKGLAAYLSASVLTSQFSDLTIEKEDVVSSSSSNELLDEDQRRIKRILEVSREAAERKHRAFQEREAAAAVVKRGDKDEFGLTCEETQLVCAAVFKNKNVAAVTQLVCAPVFKNKNVAAVTIQKYYRGWKRRNHFLTMRKQVIKIQAHVRGYRFRKYYRVIRVVNIMEKIMLRWRRKKYGLRDFWLDGEAMEEEDILKDFRKKKLDMTVNEALERVRNLVRCREARGQCSRMLIAFREAKTRLGVSTKPLDFLEGADFGENDTSDIDASGLLRPLEDTPASPDYLSYYQGVFNYDG